MSRADIVALGARGPLGLNALQLSMCLRAGKLEPRSCGYQDKRGRDIGVCRVGGLADDLVGYERLLALAAPALREACAAPAVAAALELAPAPMVLAVPESGRPDDDDRIEAALVADIAQRCGASVNVGQSSVVRCGHAGGAYALQTALAKLADGAQAVLVGGVDSYYHPEVLGALDDACRLHALDAEDGFIPSEGAAFIVLRGPNTAGALAALPAQARLTCVDSGREPSIETGEPNIATTMTALVERALAGAGWVMTDVNGERHRRREWSMVSLRQLAADVVIQRPATHLGDIGAAIGPTLAAVACSWWRLGCAPAGSLLIALHAEGSERGVIRLQVAE